MSNSKNKLNQEEYEKLIKLLSDRKQSKEKEIPLKTVISALEELNLLEELEHDDIKAIQGEASDDIKRQSQDKTQNSNIVGKTKLLLGIAFLGALIYTSTQLFPKITSSLWQNLTSVPKNTEETATKNSTKITDNGQATVIEGSTLNPGEAISNEGFRITVENPSFVNLPDEDYLMTFEMIISNESGAQLVTQITGENLSVISGNGKTYSEINFWHYDSKYNDYDYEGSVNRNLDIYSLAAGEEEKIKIGVAGNLDKDVDNIIVRIQNAARIKSSKWTIEVPR